MVRKPDLPGYGVELVGGDDSVRLQVRTVALAAVRDKTRDLDAETLLYLQGRDGRFVKIRQSMPDNEVCQRQGINFLQEFTDILDGHG